MSSKRSSLTARQAQALAFIRTSIDQRGYPPTLREIGEHMGIRSTNGVNDHLKALERKGYLVRDGLKSRALRPVDDDHASERLPDGWKWNDSLIEHGIVQAVGPSFKDSNGAIKVSLALVLLGELRFQLDSDGVLIDLVRALITKHDRLKREGKL